MDYIADLHVHSPFSRATSPECDPTGLFAWARIKGIQVVASGDFTHPGWLNRLKEALTPAEPGLYRLRDENVPAPLPGTPAVSSGVRFVLSAEISCIYKRHGAVRKVHNLVYVPDFASAERLSMRLAGIGNIESDGRPILGLDSRNLLEIVLGEAPEGFLVPAHIWTPWFSLFGSKSGFDAVEECFGDLTPHVFALETGLSSDPDMNRMISALDRFALISNSDCHSPSRLGREANLFSTGFDYFSLREAVRHNNRDTFRGTIEFFPEEGKYHLDGHRACKVCLEPEETRRRGGRCPVCGRPLTVGVLHRVLELADRERPAFTPEAPGFFSLVPLTEVLGEILGVGPASKQVLQRYVSLIGRFGSEFNLLLHCSREELAEESPLLAEAVMRIREGSVIRHGGFDGEFGSIRVFEEGEIARLQGQFGLFPEERPKRVKRKKEPGEGGGGASAPPSVPERSVTEVTVPVAGPNPEQAEAISCRERRILVTAGPGTGKTYTLTRRLASLVAAAQTAPERICAITFTNRAADEVRERLAAAVGDAGDRVFVGTFHRFCLDRLRAGAPALSVIGPESRDRILKHLFPGSSRRERASLSDLIAAFLVDSRGVPPPDEVRLYLDRLSALSALDLDAVVPSLLERLEQDPGFRERLLDGIDHLFVDEFQDLNAAQYRLVEILGQKASVFAIGDPDQSIYGFRGSDPSFFFRFAAEPDTRRIPLLRNYRSAPLLIEASSAVIARNSGRDHTGLLPVSPREGRIELHRAPTPAAEAELVVRRIEEFMGGISSFSLASGRGGDQGAAAGSFGEMAVLYRLSRQADELAEALHRRGIPFQLVGATPFFLSPGCRAVTRFLWSAAGSRETSDWLSLLGTLPGFGDSALERLDAALPLIGDFFPLARSLELGEPVRSGLGRLESALEDFRRSLSAIGLAAAMTDALPFLGADPSHPDCARLLSLAGSFGRDLDALSRHLRLYAAETVYDERAEAVALMTLHAAKGLEFPVVFITGCEEGLLPCTVWRDTDIEEERRLFYVGLTRARETLVLSASLTRPGTGPGERPLSRFLGEIPPHLIHRTVPERKGRGNKAEQMELF